MTIFETLNSIERDYGLNNLCQMGVISWSQIWHRDLYIQYDVYIRLGNRVTTAVRLTADRFDVDERTVYKAIKKMKYDPKGDTHKRLQTL